jgi:PAS domain S-box-containing protein
MDEPFVPNILVVDDIDANLILINTILKKEDAQIVLARSGDEALSKATDIDFALMILDVSMPGMNGFELAEQFRTIERFRYTPIIFVSALYSDERSIFKGYQSGAVDYITKPFKHEILISKVRIFLQLAVQNEKIREQSLRLFQSEERYRSYIENAPDGVFVATSDGLPVQVNSAAARITGYTEKELFGMNLLHFFRNENLADNQENFAGIFSGSKAGGEFRIATRDGLVRFILAETVILPDGRYLGFIKDNTERHELVKQLIQTERLAGIGELAAGMAHEINQPLNTIAFGLDNLFNAFKSQHPDEAYIRKKGDKIFEGIMRMRNIIDHVRTFSRDQDNFVPVVFDVTESIRNALSLVSEQYKKLGIELVTDFGPVAYFPFGNTYKFEQVILNLLSNARDAITEKRDKTTDSYTGVIDIKTLQTASELIVTVKDDGKGISPGNLSHVMQPFYTTKDPGKGTGLGLSISYGIIREMGGEIRMESSPEKGTTIQVIIPVKFVTAT